MNQTSSVEWRGHIPYAGFQQHTTALIALIASLSISIVSSGILSVAIFKFKGDREEKSTILIGTYCVCDFIKCVLKTLYLVSSIRHGERQILSQVILRQVISSFQLSCIMLIILITLCWHKENVAISYKKAFLHGCNYYIKLSLAATLFSCILVVLSTFVGNYLFHLEVAAYVALFLHQICFNYLYCCKGEKPAVTIFFCNVVTFSFLIYYSCSLAFLCLPLVILYYGAILGEIIGILSSFCGLCTFAICDVFTLNFLKCRPIYSYNVSKKPKVIKSLVI